VEAQEYQTLFQVETTYWWHVGRQNIINSFLRRAYGYIPHRDRQILDVGCGTGATMQHLKQFGTVTGIDFAQEALDFCRQRGEENVRRMDATQMSFDPATFDLVTAFDVLEHLDDLAALREIHRVLKPEGYLLLTVPAYMFLWSDHDRALHHLRRYTRPEIVGKLVASGFSIHKASYLITTFFPIIVGFRLLNRVLPSRTTPKASYFMLPRPINRFFTGLLHLEARLVNYLSFPVGTSVMVLARKEIAVPTRPE
jgi:ubiquinone/menaquinone biosynthesis C-methylase UbiE